MRARLAMAIHLALLLRYYTTAGSDTSPASSCLISGKNNMTEYLSWRILSTLPTPYTLHQNPLIPWHILDRPTDAAIFNDFFV